MDVAKTRAYFHDRYGKGYLTWEQLNKIDEVLIALEAAQAELAEKQKLADDFMELMHQHIDDNTDLRKQLAEAQAENKRFRHMNGFTPDASRDK